MVGHGALRGNGADADQSRLARSLIKLPRQDASVNTNLNFGTSGVLISPQLRHLPSLLRPVTALISASTKLFRAVRSAGPPRHLDQTISFSHLPLVNPDI
jgi:hypothetical protein